MTKSVMSAELISKLMDVVNNSSIITPKEANRIIFVFGAGIGVLDK